MPNGAANAIRKAVRYSTADRTVIANRVRVEALEGRRPPLTDISNLQKPLRHPQVKAVMENEEYNRLDPQDQRAIVIRKEVREAEL